MAGIRNLEKAVVFNGRPHKNQAMRYVLGAGKILNQIIHHSVDAQKTLFSAMLASPAFGAAASDNQIKTYEQFRRQIPDVGYDHPFLQEWMKRRTAATLPAADQIQWFARTSGTTQRKYIPVSRRFIHANHYQCARLGQYHLVNHWGFKGAGFPQVLSLYGYAYPEKHEGRPVFDISALLIAQMPWLFRQFNFPNTQFTTWPEKAKYILSHFQKINKTTVIAGVPTWILSLFEQVQSRYGQPPAVAFNRLQLYIHGGVNFSHYFSLFRDLFKERPLMFFEVYNATEGFWGFQYQKNEPGLLLLTAAGNFFEFRDMHSGEVLPIWEAALDWEYELVVSNADGLVRYRTGDVIRFQQKDPWLFQIMGRTTECLNSFGEDLFLNQVHEALQKVSGKMTFRLAEFFVLPLFPSADAKGRHQWFVEFDQAPPSLSAFAEMLDAELQRINGNYQQKREGNLAMESLELVTLERGTIESLLSRRAHGGGQVKQKRLYNNREILKELPEIGNQH